MVSTRRKSYQPTPPVTPDPGAPAAPVSAGRQRHNSLSHPPPAAASPRRSRRASSLTPFESERSSAESALSRGHRTKALLERYRSEAAGTLKAVEEETALAEKEDVDVVKKTGADPAETESGLAAAKSVPAEVTLVETESESAIEYPKETVAHDAEEESTKASDVPETATAHATQKAEEVEESISQEPELKVNKDSSEVMQVDDEEEVDVESIDVEQISPEEMTAQAAARKVAAAQRVLASVSKETTPVDTAASVLPPVTAPSSAPALTRVRPAPKPRGMAKSGRFWKSVRTRASTVVVRDSVSYEVRMQKRKQQQAVKDLENQLKDERKQKLEDLRRRREYNTKKATENALKAEVYQVVKNPNKIKRMKKKQLRLLQKRDTTVVGKSVLDE